MMNHPRLHITPTGAAAVTPGLRGYPWVQDADEAVLSDTDPGHLQEPIACPTEGSGAAERSWGVKHPGNPEQAIFTMSLNTI